VTTGRPIIPTALNGALPAVNLVTLVAAVAVLWWRAQRVETQVDALRATVSALQVDVARLTQALDDRP